MRAALQRTDRKFLCAGLQVLDLFNQVHFCQWLSERYAIDIIVDFVMGFVMIRAFSGEFDFQIVATVKAFIPEITNETIDCSGF